MYLLYYRQLIEIPSDHWEIEEELNLWSLKEEVTVDRYSKFACDYQTSVLYPFTALGAQSLGKKLHFSRL